MKKYLTSLTRKAFSIDTLDLIIHYIDPQPKKSGHGNVFVMCPNPEHLDLSRENCSVSLTKQLFNCFACGAKGHIAKALNWKKAPNFIIDAVSSMRSSPLISMQPDVCHYLDEDILFAYNHVPQQWIDEGFDPKLLSEHGIGYDHYLNRITIPIRDVFGNLVAISGRNLDESSIGKYKVYKTELGDFEPLNYRPRVHDHLWRANLLEDSSDPLVVVEGYKAALWLVQCGLTSTVAIMGSHMSEDQTNLVSRLTDEVWLMLDMDEAGRRGQNKSAINLYRRGLTVRYVEYATNVKQPDDLTMCEVHKSFNNLKPWRS